jgi:DNA recombination protein RmuC
MLEIVSYLTLGLSALAAIFTLLLLLGIGRKLGVQSGPDESAKISDTVRTEADRVRQDAAEQSRSIRQNLDDAIARFQDSMLGRLDVATENIRQPISGIGQKLDADIAKMGEEASAGREALRTTIETKLDTYGDRQANAARELKAELTTSFASTTEALSGTLQLLGVQQKERLESVSIELKGMAERQNAAQEALRTAVESRLDAIRIENATKLDEMRQTVDEKLQTTLEARLGESFRLVSEQLDRVHQGLGEMQNLAIGVGDLKRVLSNVKVRGTMAEGQLGTLLEQYLSAEQFIRNAQVKEHSAERVEFAIKFPGRGAEAPVLLPIDAKFPTDDYDRLMQAAERADVEAVEQAAAALELRVKSFAKAIAEKYINTPTTTDYAILFLPTEGLFAEVLRRPGLHEQMQRDFRVMIAGPTNICAMLSAFQMGFQSLAIQERSSEVWTILGAVRTEFADHGKVVAKLQKQLGTASKTIDELGTRTRAMNRKLKDVQTLPGEQAQNVLGLTNAVLASAEDTEDESD